MWGRGLRGDNAACLTLCWLSVTSSTTQKQIRSFWCWFPGGWIFVCSRTLWVSPTNYPVRLWVSPTGTTPTGFFQLEVLRLYFSMLESWVVWSVLFPSCCFWFICTQMWDCLLHQLQPFHESFLPICPSPPLLLVWMNFSSLTPWLLDFHTVRFSGSSGWFLFLNLLLSFFWLCEEAQCIYLHVHVS